MRALLFAALSAATGSAFAVSCGDTITRDTRLDRDLDCRGAAIALTIERSGVTLDLNGHTLRADGNATAIALEDVRDATIRGGRIVGADTGVEATRSKGLRVTGVELVDVGTGVRLVNSSRAEIAHNRFDGVESHAVAVLALPYALTRGGGHSIHDNTILRSEYGVLLSGADSGRSRIAANRFSRIGTFAVLTESRNRIEDDNDFDDVGVADVAY